MPKPNNTPTTKRGHAHFSDQHKTIQAYNCRMPGAARYYTAIIRIILDTTNLCCTIPVPLENVNVN